MTGPEHYRCAEAALSAITDDLATRHPAPPDAEVAAAVALAQAHATLALAAAQAMASLGLGETADQWRSVLAGGGDL